jgi:hypothetical protein
MLFSRFPDNFLVKLLGVWEVIFFCHPPFFTVLICCFLSRWRNLPSSPPPPASHITFHTRELSMQHSWIPFTRFFTLCSRRPYVPSSP